MTRALCTALAFALTLGAGAAVAYEMPPSAAPGHVPEPQGLYQGGMHGYTPNGVTGGKVVDTAGLAKMIADGTPVLLDVAEKDRKPPTMAPGMIWAPTHRSIPRAVFLQGGGNGTSDPGFGEAFKARVAALTRGDRTRPIVTFCHPDCWGSYNAAKRLIGLGYTQVYWYRDGVEGWQASNETRIVKPDAVWLDTLPKSLTQ